MGLRSMTGFGRATVEVAGVACSVEVKTVNHRHLDLKVRLPRFLSAVEPAVRARLSTVVHRGRVDLSVNATTDGAAPTSLELNLALAERLLGLHRELAERLEVPQRVDTAWLADYPGVLVAGAAAVDEGETQAQLLLGLDAALDALLAMRRREGEALAVELERRVDSVASVAQRIGPRIPQLSLDFRARLERRLRDLLATLDLEVDEGRILHEVGIFAEKSDVAEELTRLQSHLDQCRTLMQTSEETPVGRRLDFVFQEMNREANTIGSKIGDVEVSNLVIELKAELERLREQVQNVE